MKRVRVRGRICLSAYAYQKFLYPHFPPFTHKVKETRQALIYGAAMLEFSCLVTQKSQKSQVQYIEMKLQVFYLSSDIYQTSVSMIS